MTYKIFKKGIKSSTNREFIKIVGLNISMNSNFIRKNNLRKYEFVNIYTDETEKYFLIGFEFTEEEGENSFKLSKTGKQDNRFVSASSLLKNLNIERGRYKESYFIPKKTNFEEKQIFEIKIPKNEDKPGETESDTKKESEE